MDMDPRVAKRWAEDYPWLDFSRRYYARKGCKVCNQSITGKFGPINSNTELLNWLSSFRWKWITEKAPNYTQTHSSYGCSTSYLPYAQ